MAVSPVSGSVTISPFRQLSHICKYSKMIVVLLAEISIIRNLKQARELH